MHKIALIGNPNSGKTTLFNRLTGAMQYVGNWPGVTVEKKEGQMILNGMDIKVVDLPGIYSLSPYTMEEIVSRDYIIKEKPDIVIDIIDASNLERNLYLSTQILELGIKVIFVLNMMDVVDKKGDKINIQGIKDSLTMPIVEISASKGTGIRELKLLIEKTLKSPYVDNSQIGWLREDIKEATFAIKEKIEKGTFDFFNALKLLEHDSHALKEYQDNKEILEFAKGIRVKIEDKYDDDIESLIIIDRYEYISNIVKEAYTRNSAPKETVTEKIDRIVLHRFFAIPLFLAAIYLMFAFAFGPATTFVMDLLDGFIQGDLASFVLNILEKYGASEFTKGLLVDGIIAGVGSVIVFIPQLMVLFFFISVLEDSGYMARAALMTDRFLRKIGLTGKSFIPFIVGFGCSVPAIMAARTLDSEKDRRLTIFLAPFMSCGARAPVYAMIATAYFASNKSLVIFSVYLMGIIVAAIMGIILSKTIFKGEEAPFIMELPDYRMPTLRSLFTHMWDRSKDFIKKAGTIIFVASVIVWLLTNLNSSFAMTSNPEESLIAYLGRSIAVIFKPLGFGNWIASVALITGVFAKESVVSTLNVLAGQGQVGTIMTPLAAYAFLMFVLFYVPCIAAVGAMKRELNSIKWTIGAVLFQTGTAWIMAFLVYNIGRLVGGIG